MPAEPTRRRVLRIAAAAAAAAFVPQARATSREWRGAALGAEVAISFSNADAATAELAVSRILAEVERLEAIFSLQRGDSELSRLNAAGRIAAPSPDLVQVLELSRQAYAATAGKFDPTVQPLWRFHVDWYAADRSRPRPSADDLAAAKARVGLQRLRIAPDAIEMPEGAALTLNGIAQGYITDRACALLRQAGFRRVLVDLGETRALDGRADDDAWRIALPDGAQVRLADCAVAASSGAATPLGDKGDHHIFDPTTGRSAPHWRWLAVAHASAAMADALSTGLYCLAPGEAARAVRGVPGARLWALTAQAENVEV